MQEMSLRQELHHSQPFFPLAVIYLGEELTDSVTLAFFEDSKETVPAETYGFESWEEAYGVAKVRSKHSYFTSKKGAAHEAT